MISSINIIQYLINPTKEKIPYKNNMKFGRVEVTMRRLAVGDEGGRSSTRFRDTGASTDPGLFRERR